MNQDLLNQFQKALTPELLGYLSKSIGGANTEATETASNSIFSVLMNAMKNNATTSGADGLLNALNRDHDGSILDNAVELLSGMRSPSNPKTLNSAGILGHLLGNNQGNVVQKIAKISGLDALDVGQLLMKIAPLAMGVLGRETKQNNLNSVGLLDLLNTSTERVKERNPQASIFEKLLDQDGDGSIIDDIASFGLKNLGSFFKK